jgi:polyisoprenoid-binding protein YceI
MKKLYTLVFLVSLCCSSFAQQYTIDPSHTAVTSKVLRFGVVKVVGRFTSVSGTVNYNANSPAATSADITVKVDSYNANNPDGESAVKSSSWLDVKSFPEMKMVVKSLTVNAKQFIVSATLTIHGVTKDVSFPVTINGPLMDLPTQKQSIGISGSFTIKRSDYGMAPPRKLPSGVDAISDEVEIEINALAMAQ